ncbi:MarR family winged helix-turn-helix transcriptional regulator [Ferrimonas aestuarii]|nr:MarR family transcriptional regulator [Ferrimonas aestuarii]
MANKSAVHALIQSNYPTDQKVSGLLLCMAQEMKVTMTRQLLPFKISPPQLMMLHALDKGPKEGLTVGQLKEGMLEDSSNVSRSLNKLEESGLVVKRRDDEDQRIVKIIITDAGRQLHLDADEALMKIEGGLGLNESELETLFALLKKAVNNAIN